MCFAIAKIPQGTALHKEMFGTQSNEAQEQVKKIVAEATRNPLSVGKHRKRATTTNNQ